MKHVQNTLLFQNVSQVTQLPYHPFFLQNLTNDDKCIVKLSFDKLMVKKTSKSCVTDWINRFY